jgi:integrase
LADIRRRDIHANGDRLEVVVASHRAKNRHEHRLPLVAEAREIVERLLAEPGEPEDFLLRLSEQGTSMNSWKRFSEAIERASGVAFAFHDSRRLFATEAGEHDLADFTLIDACLNHAAAISKSGAARAYHHARHANARANFMVAWAALVRHAVSSGRWPREEPHSASVAALNFGTGK